MLATILLVLAIVFLFANIGNKLPLWPAVLTFAVFVIVLIAPRYLAFLQ